MRIEAKDLQEGDVLLYRGTSLLSKIIMRFDGGDYSHAGIVRGGQVTEALGDGINHRPVATSAAGSKYVDVYRFTKNGAKLGDPQYPVPPLSAAIEVFEIAKNAYAYDELLLLALLCSTRQLSGIMSAPGLSMIVRDFLDSAMELLAGLISAGRKPDADMRGIFAQTEAFNTVDFLKLFLGCFLGRLQLSLGNHRYSGSSERARSRRLAILRSVILKC